MITIPHRPVPVAPVALRAGPLLLGFITSLALLAGCGGEPADGATARGGGGQQEAPRGGQDAAGEGFDVSRLGFDEGNASTAVVQVIEFSDFGCGYCRLFHEETYPALREEFVQTGQVVWKFIPFVLGSFPNSAEAALSAGCAAEQGRLPGMRSLLFREQQTWQRSPQAARLFLEYGRAAGVNMTTFAECLTGGRAAEGVQAATETARRLGVRGTPTFFVNGEPVQGAVPLDVFRDVLREQVALRSGGAGGPGAPPPPDGR